MGEEHNGGDGGDTDGGPPSQKSDPPPSDSPQPNWGSAPTWRLRRLPRGGHSGGGGDIDGDPHPQKSEPPFPGGGGQHPPGGPMGSSGSGDGAEGYTRGLRSRHREEEEEEEEDEGTGGALRWGGARRGDGPHPPSTQTRWQKGGGRGYRRSLPASVSPFGVEVLRALWRSQRRPWGGPTAPEVTPGRRRGPQKWPRDPQR